MALASAGFLVCEPDYHGLGSSRGLQSFEQAKPLSDSAIDLLRAAKQLFARQKRPWNGQLFLAGYSEGGYAAMAVHRALESTKPAEFTVTASAPGGGPYDLSQTTLGAYLESPGENSIAYLAGNLLGYDVRYSLFRRTSEVFQTPYDRKVRKLFNGSKTTGEIVVALPSTAQGLFLPAFLKAVEADENHPVRVRLRENDVYDWKPLAPVRLFHAGGDREVPFENAVVARDRMQELGADVELINVGDGLGHSSGAVPSLVGAFAWIKTLAKGL
jgi:pimeloyl-ACP methyl ester carboxylesterase